MADVDPAPLGRLFFTGTSRFLQANEHFVGALVAASSQCSIHASEDIFDANGLKLWARGRAIDDHLLERLSKRTLRKPIELCVYASDPIAAAGIAETIEARVGASENLRALLAPYMERVLKVAGSISPNPTELMLLSVMRHSHRDLFGHAAVVTAIALAMADLVDAHHEEARTLARAGLFHDVGELYLAPALFSPSNRLSAEDMGLIRTHPVLGARVMIELAHSGAAVAHLIALSHERLDGQGYPRGLRVQNLSLAGQALLFAEAIARLVESGPNGLRRAAIAVRLVPEEFALPMVNWTAHCASVRPPVPEAAVSKEEIGLGLRQIHAIVARVLVLLNVPIAQETTKTRVAAAQWLAAVETLMRVLRSAGVDEAISAGINVEPQSDAESIELGVLCRELQHRVQTLCHLVEMTKAESPELASSSLVLELIEALRACAPAAPAATSASKVHVELLPWSNLYCVGVREIDEQHRVLVNLLNRLAATHPDGADPRFASEIVAGLAAYARKHFAYEEHLMREHDYKGAADHIAAHRGFVERVEQFAAQIQTGAAPNLEELAGFMRQWLIAHILSTDKELGIALNAHAVR